MQSRGQKSNLKNAFSSVVRIDWPRVGGRRQLILAEGKTKMGA